MLHNTELSNEGDDKHEIVMIHADCDAYYLHYTYIFMIMCMLINFLVCICMTLCVFDIRCVRFGYIIFIEYSYSNLAYDYTLLENLLASNQQSDIAIKTLNFVCYICFKKDTLVS